jgi:hypothetical protein
MRVTIMRCVSGVAMRGGAVIVDLPATSAHMHCSMDIRRHHNLSGKRGNGDHQCEQRQQRAPPSSSHVPPKPHGSRFVDDDIIYIECATGFQQKLSRYYLSELCAANNMSGHPRPLWSALREPPTGEPYAGKPPVRFGGRGGDAPSLPYREGEDLFVFRPGPKQIGMLGIGLPSYTSGADARRFVMMMRMRERSACPARSV